MSDAYRPQTFADFVGQPKAVKILQVLVKAARNRGGCIPHVLLSGPPGLGKSTLAAIVAHEMETTLVELIAGNIQSPAELARHMLAVPPKAIVLLDETHGLPRPVEEALYNVMSDFRISIASQPAGYDSLLKQLGMPSPKPTAEMRRLPEFTIMGGTTLSGLISDPLRSRFVEVIDLRPYEVGELRQILGNAAHRMQLDLSEDAATEIARRSRQTARTALGYLRFLSEWCAATGAAPDANAVRAVFDLKEVDEDGLGAVEIQYLLALVESGEPLGLASLCASISSTPETVAQVIEPFLIRTGFVRKSPRGRVPLPKAYAKLGRAA